MIRFHGRHSGSVQAQDRLHPGAGRAMCAGKAPRQRGLMEDRMGSFSIWHWMVVLLVVLLLFGGNKMSGLMGDFAKGIKSFKKNMAEPDDASMEDSAGKPAGTISGPTVEASARATRETTSAR
jgi:sec-independent protein translocase protein TatA